MSDKSKEAITRAAISQAAISELDRLSLFLDDGFDGTASMSIEEIDDELREMGVDPDQPIPAQISQAFFAGAGHEQASNAIHVSAGHANMHGFEADNTRMSAYVYVPNDHLHDECSDEVKLLILGIRDFGQQQRYEEALELAREAIRLEPDYWRVWICLGTLLVLFGKVDDGENIFTGISKDFPDNPKAVAAGLHSRAWVKEMRYGPNPSAAALYEEALQLDGSRANTRACLVINRLMLDRVSDDKELLEESVFCEGFFDALRFEINERRATALKIIQALPTWLRHLLFPISPLYADGSGY